MAQIIGLPKLSPTMEEGVLVRWTKKEGDKVSPGDLVAEVETDKANMDFNIEDEGVLLKLLVKEGDTVKLGAPVAIIGKAGEDVSSLMAEASKGGGGGGDAPRAKSNTDEVLAKASSHGIEESATAPAAQQGKKSSEQKAASPAVGASAARQASAAKQAPQPPPQPGKLLASPLAKTLAIELGIDLRTVKGSGPGGRIVERDVRSVADGQPTQGGNGKSAERPEQLGPDEVTAVDSDTAETAIAVRQPRQMPMPGEKEGDYEDVPASNMRKRIAARLTEAKRDVPHFYLMRKLDAAPLLAFRGRLNELLGDRGKVSVNDLVIKAVALALRRVPECNASWEGDAIRHHHRVHIGVAVAIEDGLVTPVVRDADQKGIGAIAAEVRDLAERAKTKRLKGHEITGSTFTVSNLGMFGIERFTAIINPPEGGILAVGTTVDEPVVQ